MNNDRFSSDYFAKYVREILRDQQEQVRDYLRQARDRYQETLRAARAGPSLSEAASEVYRRVAEAWRRALEEQLPENWRGMTFDEQEAVISLAREMGWCLAWVPRQAVLRELLGVDPEQRESILLEHSAAVLDDCRACLDEAPTASVELKTQASASIDTYQDGHWRAAQALGAAVLTTAIEKQLGYGRMSNAEGQLPSDPDEAEITLLRLAVVASAIDFASYFHPEEGPANFSRNRSLHHADDMRQYTEANSLTSLMLLAALLREAEFWYPDGTNGEGS